MEYCSTHCFIFYPGEDTMNSSVFRALRYMCDEYANIHGLTDIANHVGLTLSHLERLFYRELHTTVGKALDLVRLDAMKELLCTTELKHFEISYQVGLKNIYTASRWFKRQAGMTMTEFRQQCRTEAQGQGKPLPKSVGKRAKT
jgi:transcriptional regulator GlxA family with amidase domain